MSWEKEKLEQYLDWVWTNETDWVQQKRAPNNNDKNDSNTSQQYVAVAATARREDVMLVFFSLLRKFNIVVPMHLHALIYGE